MDQIQCLACGQNNNSESTTCQRCREMLLKGDEYEKKLQELKDYDEFRKRYSLLAIILALLLLLLSYPVIDWIIRFLFSLPGMGPLPTDIVKYAAPAIILIVLILVFPQMISGRLKILRKYRWTRVRKRVLSRTIKSLPKGFLATKGQHYEGSEAPVQAIQGPPTVLLVIIFALLGLAYVNEYTDLKPMDSIRSLIDVENTNNIFGNGKAQTVNGRYDCHVDAKDLGGGVMQSEQTWSYAFNPDGTYTSYLEGSEQYSGTWSQSGSTLTINIPAIANISAAYSFTARVSSDGNSITSGERVFIKRSGD